MIKPLEFWLRWLRHFFVSKAGKGKLGFPGVLLTSDSSFWSWAPGRIELPQCNAGCARGTVCSAALGRVEGSPWHLALPLQMQSRFLLLLALLGWQLWQERWCSTLVVPAPSASSHTAACGEERGRKRGAFLGVAFGSHQWLGDLSSSVLFLLRDRAGLQNWGGRSIELDLCVSVLMCWLLLTSSPWKGSVLQHRAAMSSQGGRQRYGVAPVLPPVGPYCWLQRQAWRAEL